MEKATSHAGPAGPRVVNGTGGAALPDDWCLHHFDHLSPTLQANLPETMARMRELCPVAHSDQHGEIGRAHV